MSPILFYTGCMAILFIVCLLIGLYFLLKPNHKGVPTEVWINSLDVAPEVKAVRLKEFHKQTAPKFTKAWFLEFWRGQRTPWSTFWTWLFFGKILFVVLLVMLPSFLYGVLTKQPVDANPPALLLLIFETGFFLYMIFALVLLWKSARNALNPTRRLTTNVVVILFAVILIAR